MAKINMTTLNIELTSWNRTKSNKNITSDILNEIASIMRFDMKYLCENFNVAIGYSFEETDVPMIKEMLELAKSKEGKMARCKKYDLCTYSVINQWFNTFCVLAKNNGIGSEELKKQMIKMHKQTDYIILKKNMYDIHPDIEELVVHYFFAPTDYFVDEDDLLNVYDKILFLEYIASKPELTVSTICGLYWCFVKMRESIINQHSIEQLRGMSMQQRRDIIMSIVRKIEFERALAENDEYVEVIQKLADINGGNGKLKDKKLVKPLINRLVSVMDKEAEGILDDNEYSKGFVHKVENTSKDTEKCFDESREVFCRAIRWYSELLAMRIVEPVDDKNETIIEIEFFSRFNSRMF